MYAFLSQLSFVVVWAVVVTAVLALFMVVVVDMVMIVVMIIVINGLGAVGSQLLLIIDSILGASVLALLL